MKQIVKEMKFTVKENKVYISLIVCLVLFVFVGCKGANNELSKKDNTVNIDDVASFTYQEGLQVNPDIPFKLLVDKEYIKMLPDTFNYEAYKPNVLLLPKDLNVKDTADLGSFPSIAINLENPGKVADVYLGSKVRDYLIGSLANSILGTSYKINLWKDISTFVSKDSVNGLLISYRQINDDNKALNIDNSYLFPHGKMIRITLTSPDSTYNEWKKYYDDIISSVVFNNK